MQDWPLLMHKVIDFAAVQFPEQQVASRTVEGPMHYTNYRAIRERALKVAKRLERDGIKLSDRVATLAWNTLPPHGGLVRHHGHGRGLPHPQPALFPEQIGYIINHAEDQFVFTDLTFVPLLRRSPTRADRRALRRDDRRGAHAGDQAENAIGYEDLVGRGRRRLRLGRVRREHRRRPLLHLGHHRQSEGRALLAPLELPARADGDPARRASAAARDIVLPIVPMFHANAWGLRFAAPMVGRQAGDAGPEARRRLVYELIETESVTFSRRGAHRLADAAAPPASETGASSRRSKRVVDRRLGLPERDDPRLPGRLRRRGHPRLGHDRDVPARHARLAQARARPACSTTTARRSSSSRAAPPFGVEMKIIDDDGKRCRTTARPSAG